MLSLKKTFLLRFLISLVMFLLLLGLLIHNNHHKTLLSKQEAELKNAVLTVLGHVDINENDELFVDVNALEQSINFDQNTLLVFDAQGQVLFRSNSSEAIQFKNLGLDQWSFEKINQGFLINYGVVILTNSKQNEWLINVAIFNTGQSWLTQMHAFDRDLILWLSIGLFGLLLIVILLLQWSFGFLGKIEADVKAIENGQSTLLNLTYPFELLPLSKQFNSLLVFERSQRKRFKESLDNLAHQIKTPLAAINNMAQNNPAMLEQIFMAQTVVDHQLKKASLVGQKPFLRPIALTPILEQLIRSIAKVYKEKNISFETRCDPNTTLKIDEGDLFELLGNIIENSAKHCTSTVKLIVDEKPSCIDLIIEDDGKGFDQILLQNPIERGKTLSHGTGLGLAIAHEIVDVYEAQLFLSNTQGGASVLIRFKK